MLTADDLWDFEGGEGDFDLDDGGYVKTTDDPSKRWFLFYSHENGNHEYIEE